MPDAFCGPFSAHLQCRVYCSLPICGLIWQCLFISLQSPQYHPATNPQYRPESLPAPSLLSALATGMLLPPKIDAVASSPAVGDGEVFIGSEGSTMYALHARTGKLLWSYAIAFDGFSEPTLADGIVYIATGSASPAHPESEHDLGRRPEPIALLTTAQIRRVASDCDVIASLTHERFALGPWLHDFRAIRASDDFGQIYLQSAPLSCPLLVSFPGFLARLTPFFFGAVSIVSFANPREVGGVDPVWRAPRPRSSANV